MNNLNLDPGLRQAFTQQTHQRLLSESNRARLVKSVPPKTRQEYKVKQYSLRLKISHIAQVIQEAGSTIATILRASSYSANA